jgi:hypothetical protein
MMSYTHKIKHSEGGRGEILPVEGVGVSTKNGVSSS